MRGSRPCQDQLRTRPDQTLHAQGRGPKRRRIVDAEESRAEVWLKRTLHEPWHHLNGVERAAVSLDASLVAGAAVQVHPRKPRNSASGARRQIGHSRVTGLERAAR